MSPQMQEPCMRGSANAKNASNLLAIDNLDGFFLVGGAFSKPRGIC